MLSSSRLLVILIFLSLVLCIFAHVFRYNEIKSKCGRLKSYKSERVTSDFKDFKKIFQKLPPYKKDEVHDYLLDNNVFKHSSLAFSKEFPENKSINDFILQTNEYAIGKLYIVNGENRRYFVIFLDKEKNYIVANYQKLLSRLDNLVYSDVDCRNIPLIHIDQAMYMLGLISAFIFAAIFYFKKRKIKNDLYLSQKKERLNFNRYLSILSEYLSTSLINGSLKEGCSFVKLTKKLKNYLSKYHIKFNIDGIDKINDIDVRYVLIVEYLVIKRIQNYQRDKSYINITIDHNQIEIKDNAYNADEVDSVEIVSQIIDFIESRGGELELRKETPFGLTQIIKLEGQARELRKNIIPIK